MALADIYNWVFWEQQNATMAANGAASLDANGVLSINSTVANSRDMLGRVVDLRGGDLVEFEIDAIAISGTTRIMCGLGGFTSAGTDAMGGGAESKAEVEIGAWKHYYLKYKVPAHIVKQRGWAAVGTGLGVTGYGKFKNPIFKVNGTQVGGAPTTGGFLSSQGSNRSYNIAINADSISLANEYNAANVNNKNINAVPVGEIPSSFTMYGVDSTSSGLSIVNLNGSSAMGANLRLASSVAGNVIGAHGATAGSSVIGEIHVYGDDGTQWAESGCIQFQQAADAGDGYVPTHILFKNSTESGFKTELKIWGTGSYGGVTPGSDNNQMLGSPAHRWSQLYAASGSISTSDIREKDNIETPSDALMRAWGKVNFKVFQMRNAIAAKGAAKARLHVGVIAQEVAAAFASEGLDVQRYGLFCYDEWEDEYEAEMVADVKEHFDPETGNVVSAKEHAKKRLVKEAGSLYGIRYEEALAIECAYQRWRLQQLEQRVNQITNNDNS